MKGKLILSTVLIGMSALTAGCASTGMTPARETLMVTPQVSALEELKKVSVEARHELRLLAKAQESIAQKAMTREQAEQRFYEATVVPLGFDKLVDFNYTGYASKAAEAIAMVAGYHFDGPNNPSYNEPTVNIFLKNEPLNEALKELGVQTGSKARIEIHQTPDRILRFVQK